MWIKFSNSRVNMSRAISYFQDEKCSKTVCVVTGNGVTYRETYMTAKEAEARVIELDEALLDEVSEVA